MRLYIPLFCSLITINFYALLAFIIVNSELFLWNSRHRTMIIVKPRYELKAH